MYSFAEYISLDPDPKPDKQARTDGFVKSTPGEETGVGVLVEAGQVHPEPYTLQGYLARKNPPPP